MTQPHTEARRTDQPGVNRTGHEAPTRPRPDDSVERGLRSIREAIALHASERWAEAVIRVMESPRDPRTTDAWGRLAGASPSTLRAWCIAAHCGVKASLDFARVLRAVSLAAESREWDPWDLLDIVDYRTLRRLMSLARLQPSHGEGSNVEAFLDRHQFSIHPCAAQAIRAQLAARGLVKYPNQTVVSPDQHRGFMSLKICGDSGGAKSQCAGRNRMYPESVGASRVRNRD